MSNRVTNSRPCKFIHGALFLLSAAMLHIQMVQMRICSLALWHHLAYLVITITMLGIGMSGTFLSVFPSMIRRRSALLLSGSSILFGLTTFVAFMITSGSRLDTFKLLTPSGIQFSELFLLFGYYGAFILPFFCAGIATTTLFCLWPRDAQTLYFTNLTGAAAGVGLFALSMSPLGAERSLILGCILAVCAGLLFSLKYNNSRGSFCAIFIICVLTCIAWISPQLIEPIPAPSKAYGKYLDQLPDFKRLYSKWNTISRIDVIASNRKLLDWLDTDRTFPPHMAITLDGDATTWMWHFGKPPQEVCSIQDDLYAAAYHTKREPEVLIVGLGGGNDIRTALHYSAKRVLGIELNPLIVDILTREFSDFVDEIPTHPGVEIVTGEGRSTIHRLKDRFDVIQLSGVDTWSGLASGAYVLSENYLYTVEAFHDYFDHLKPDGVLAINRWYFNPPREMLRMVTVATQAMAERGVARPWEHIIVLAEEHFCSTLFKNSPWTSKEIAVYNRYDRLHDRFELKYVPGTTIDNPFASYLDALENGKGQQYIKDYVYDVEPVRDDNPFFFDYYKWRHLPWQVFSSGTGGQIGANWPIAMTLLMAMLIQSVVLSAVFILAPLVRHHRAGPDSSHAIRAILFFACLGLAYMFIEIVWMQRFVLYLGHPSHSIAVVLPTLLFFSGIGSRIASRWLPENAERRLGGVLIATSGVLVAMNGIIPCALDWTISQTFIQRVLLTILLIAPIAILMGIPFATGLRLFSRIHESIVPWAWGTNACMSVLGSIVSVIIAMSLGFKMVFYFGAALYLAASVLVLLYRVREK